MTHSFIYRIRSYFAGRIVATIAERVYGDFTSLGIKILERVREKKINCHVFYRQLPSLLE